MNTALTIPPEDDLDSTMRQVARGVAMGIYELPKILEIAGIKMQEFMQWRSHPRFLKYLKSETDAWTAATNTAERTKVKAGIVMEEWMAEAYVELKDRKQPLNHRVELGKLVAKIAGMGEPANAFNSGPTGNGFSLQINISPGHVTTIRGEAHPVEDAVVEEVQPRRQFRAAIPEDNTTEEFVEDDYDPFSSPDTLGDM